MVVVEFVKGVEHHINDDFVSTDFDCHCHRPECNKTLISMDLIGGLSKLIGIFPIIHIDSGFRCAAHNREVGGKIDSQHLKGLAADITTPFGRPIGVKEAAEKIECFENGGIGLYPSFVHVDVRGHKARW